MLDALVVHDHVDYAAVAGVGDAVDDVGEVEEEECAVESAGIAEVR